MEQSHQASPAGESTLVGRVSRVSLRVRDLIRSASFYKTVLGCTEVESTLLPRHIRRLRLAAVDAPDADVIELVAGRSIRAVPGMDYFSVEAPSPGDVDQIHARAVQQAVRVLPVRSHCGERSCMIFDPDGYQIEVYARPDPTGGAA